MTLAFKSSMIIKINIYRNFDNDVFIVITYLSALI